MDEALKFKQILVNIRNWVCWEYKDFSLREDEARIVAEALEEAIQRREKKADE